MPRLDLSWRDGRAERIESREHETVLAAAEREGVALPFGCRIGACATCTGRLLEGELSHTRNPRALKDQHLDAGYVLLCIAAPEADCRIAVGAEIARALVSNPWK